MARTIAPLLSFEAAGQIAKTQVYATWKGRPYVRRYTIPANPRTADQTLTRNTFKWLNDVWKFMPGSAVSAWNIYADVSRFTARNGFIKQNLSGLREETDLDNFIFSPSARSGLSAASMVVTPGSEELEVTLVAPALPVGWSIVRGIAAAIRQQDPQTDSFYTVSTGDDATAPYEITLTGLTASQEYVVGGWFEFERPDGLPAFGQSLMDTGTPTA